MIEEYIVAHPQEFAILQDSPTDRERPSDFAVDAGLVDHQLAILSETPPSMLLRFPVTEIADDVLRSFGFEAASFQAA